MELNNPVATNHWNLGATCRHAVLFEQLKQDILKITSDILSKIDASYTRNHHEPIIFWGQFFLYHLGPQAIFSFVPEGASSAHLVLGQVPHYAIKPGTLVWTDAESLHGGDNGTTW